MSTHGTLYTNKQTKQSTLTALLVLFSKTYIQKRLCPFEADWTSKLLQILTSSFPIVNFSVTSKPLKIDVIFFICNIKRSILGWDKISYSQLEHPTLLSYLKKKDIYKQAQLCALDNEIMAIFSCPSLRGTSCLCPSVT